MHYLKCPKQETLLELLTIPQELSFLNRLLLKLHTKGCLRCREVAESIQSSLTTYFNPEPDIASSLIRVYSRLQRDETLILSGWKLPEFSATKQQAWKRYLWSGGWLFRGAVLTGLGLLILVLIQKDPSPSKAILQRAEAPFAQVRFEDSNRVRVHYVRPELLHSIEFETTR